jgi:hypothetical protein
MALRANIDFLGQVPFAERIGDRDESGYRPVPESDKGNAGYRDRGGLGSYTPSREPYRNPSDVKMFAGYGASEEDLQRGYCEPAIREDPAYDLDNYKDRSSQPMSSDIDEGGDAMADDYAFRRLNERSRGFLTRPRIPTDR